MNLKTIFFAALSIGFLICGVFLIREMFSTIRVIEPKQPKGHAVYRITWQDQPSFLYTNELNKTRIYLTDGEVKIRRVAGRYVKLVESYSGNLHVERLSDYIPKGESHED